MKGYHALVLHAHLPFVRHPEHEFFLEEDWLFEAITETYLPLLERFENLVEIRILLDGLDEDRRHALLLTQILGLSYAEAADVCGCPVGTIRSRVARAREDLMTAAHRNERAPAPERWRG